MDSKPDDASRPFVALHDVLVREGHGGRRGGTAPPVTLQIARGEFLSIVGAPAGMGLPLLRLVAGLEPPGSGRVEVDGAAPSPDRVRCGLLFSAPVLLGWRTVLGNVLLASELMGGDAAATLERASYLLAVAGLDEARGLRPDQLSRADAQRVCLCRALLTSPPLLLLDDPFVGVGPIEREQFARELQRLLAGSATTVLMLASGTEEAVLLSDRVAVMAPDGIVQSIQIDLPRPRLPDAETVPRIAEHVGRLRVLLEANGCLA